MTSSTKKGVWVVSRRILVAVVLAGAVVAGAVAVDRARPEEEVAVAADPLTVAAAERTDLSADATLDGTVESSSSLTVLHRIEGATPSTSTGSTTNDGATGTAPANGAPVQGVGFVQLQPASFLAAGETSSTSSSSPATTSTSTLPDSATTEPTPAPDSTTPTTTPGTIVPDTSAPDTSAPDATPTATTPDTTATTVAPDPPASTAPAAPVETTGPRGGARGGGAFPSGGGGLGAGGTASGATGSGTGTTSITERVTSLPAVGQSIALGDVLYTVDGRPVVALTGTLPAWRALSTSSADGPDIAQLELSLAALGYDADGTLVVDNEYDSATAEAVEAWQTGLGLEATGEVELGDVVFLPSTVTVTALATTVGADITEADQIVDVSGSSQQVVASVNEDAQPVVVPGLAVTIGASAGPVDGIVTLLRSVAADDGTITVEAVITPTSEMTGQADGSAVDVTVGIDGPTDAITVPAEAIVSRLDGTYAVEVRDDTGDHFVAVEVLDVRGSKVAVSGIEAGTEVLVPA